MNKWVAHSTRLLAAAALLVAAGCSSSTKPASTGTSTTAGSTGGSSAASAFPVTIGSGKTAVTIPAKPTRIVSLSPTATEDLFAIGAGSQVVAVDKNSDYPTSAPHTSLDAYQLNAEAVAAYRPDLVIESGLTASQLHQLTTLKLTVIDQEPATSLAGAYSQITDLGQATGQVSAAATLVSSMRQHIDSIVSSTPKPKPGTDYYYELDQTYYSVTSSTFIGQLFKLLGVTSIADTAKGAAAAGGYPQLSGEYVIKANPGYLFLADTRCCAQSPATVAARPGWSVMSAVKGGRVVPLDDDIASRWGPRVVDLLQTVASAMKAHPAS